MTTTTLYALLFCWADATADECLFIGDDLPEGCQTTMAYMMPAFEGLDGAFRCVPQETE